MKDFTLFSSFVAAIAPILLPSTYCFQCSRSSRIHSSRSSVLLASSEPPDKEPESPFFEEDEDSFVTIKRVYVAEVESLRGEFPSFENEGDEGSNVIKSQKRNKAFNSAILLESLSSSDDDSHTANIEYNHLMEDRELVLADTVRRPGMASVSRAFHRAGPRKLLHFDPAKVNAAIVTCGGLCPGLNNVIRELTHSLHYLYGVNKVYGIRGGFNGFSEEGYPPIELSNAAVENIHHEGGTILRSGRGGFDMDKILSFIAEKQIQQLYIIGGDGTHRGAYALSKACIERKLNVAVAGIPKTIDNDVDYIDRSFGFHTAVEAAQSAIRTAKTEAMCNVPNGIGIVKLMGRSAGFLAAYSALGSGDVDLVLLPEVPIELEGPRGILPFLFKRVKEQKYAVIVVAEGAGEELLGISDVVDAGGNRARPKIGEFVKDHVEEYFEKQGDSATIKYIDPSYTVRSVPANAADSMYCMQLAQNAVHGAMAGLTGFSTGLVGNVAVYLPIPLVVASSPRTMSPYGRTWERILAMTGQPNTVPPQGLDEFDDYGFDALPDLTMH